MSEFLGCTSSPEAEKSDLGNKGLPGLVSPEYFGLSRFMARKRLDTDSLPAIARRLRAVRHWLGFRNRKWPINSASLKTHGRGMRGPDPVSRSTRRLIYISRWRIDPKWVYMGIEADMTIETMNELNAHR
jgi:hypothetical protein